MFHIICLIYQPTIHIHAHIHELPPYISHFYNYLFFSLAHIEKSIIKRNQKQPPRENQRNPRGNQEIMAILGPTFHITTKLVRVTIRPLTPPLDRIKFVNILVSNIRSFCQIWKSLLPLDPTIILQGVPNDLMCFINWPLQSIKNHIVLFVPNTPRKTTPQEKPDVVEPFQSLGWSKRHCIIEKDFLIPAFLSYELHFSFTLHGFVPQQNVIPYRSTIHVPHYLLIYQKKLY